ncbi:MULTISPECIES: tyrosine-type recombinase/integrase [unclassified Vibrio]|jgi:integrase|uniref:tyrosine-type recombinase/integrase n=1 Tax=unclassified Vibrio TaxID=2614977 RepID=UPI00354B0B80
MPHKNKNKRNTTFSYFAELFKISKKNVHQKSTQVADCSKLNILCDTFGEMNVQDLLASDVLYWVDSVDDNYKNKTINEYFRLLRAAFALAQGDKLIVETPMLKISNRSIADEAPEPNPFTLTELETFKLVDSECHSTKNLIEAMTACGARISEMIALKESNVDLNKRQLHIQSAQVLGVSKCTKTKSGNRVIEINDILYPILERQLDIAKQFDAVDIKKTGRNGKQITHETERYLFIDTIRGCHFKDVKEFSQRYWYKFLTKANELHIERTNEGIQSRGVSQLRHTFASQALTAGVNKNWLAGQMGHTDTGMIDKVYARWMTEDASDQTQKINQHFSKLVESTTDPILVPGLKKRVELKQLLLIQSELKNSEDHELKAIIDSKIKHMMQELEAHNA